MRGFRFRDFADFRSCAPGGAVGPEDQRLGEGDGTRVEFPLTKTYGEVVRDIRKPVAGSVKVAVEGVELEVAAFSVETTTGMVTLAVAAPAGAPVTAGFEFDTPVRFDADRIEITLETFGAGRMAAVPLIEVRV